MATQILLDLPYADPLLEYWVSSKRMTVWVQVNSMGEITDTAPVIRKFIGQPFDNLIGWMERQGGLKYEVIAPFKLVIKR